MHLSLQRNGNDAELEARFKSGLISVGGSPYIALAVSIEDGSGSIDVDGSGSINFSDVEKNLIIVDDGSGSLRYSDIRGTVDADT